MGWESPNSFLMLSHPLWHRMSQITQPQSSAQGSVFPVGSAESGDASDLKQLWLNNLCTCHWTPCAFPGENSLPLIILDSTCSRGPEHLGWPSFPKRYFFFSFFPKLGLIENRNPWVRTFPIPINAAFWTSQESERKPNVIPQPLRFLTCWQVKGAAGAGHFWT